MANLGTNRAIIRVSSERLGRRRRLVPVERRVGTVYTSVLD